MAKQKQMRNRLLYSTGLLVLSVFLLVSCQKEIDGSIFAGGGGTNPVNQKPKVGTIWTYRYYIYHQDGSLYQSFIYTLKAKNEETINGETWLNVVDVDADTTVYKFQAKTDGLYQYANSTSNMFCKDPAFLGESYNTYNEGGAENFVVKGVNDTLPTGIGDVVVNYYEGYRSTILIHQIWYNKYAWIVRKSTYRNRSQVTPSWFRERTIFLDKIIY